MKKFLINMAFFFVIVAVVDFSLGKVFHYIQARASGRTGAEYYVCEKASEDIIIMGSSRASHHYVPEIISEKLGMSCFNAGQDGNGIILQYGRWKMLSARYTPKLLLYDVNPSFDLEPNDNMRYIDRLKPFSNHSIVSNYISSLFPLEKYKLMSNMYQYNYKIIEMIADFSKTIDNSMKGYLPLYGEVRKEIIEKNKINPKTHIENDNIKLLYLEELIKDCKNKGVQIVFIASPAFRGGYYTKECFMPVEVLSSKYDIPFLNYYSGDYSCNKKWFKDSNHLNDNGAMLFTKVVTESIITELNN